MLSRFLDVAPVVAAIPIWDQYVDFLEYSLDFLARNLHSAGLAVVVFTIIVKTVLLPLTVKSIRSSKAMQELQPKIKELQKKYGKDRQRLSQETMRLYTEHRINPLSGCLPMLIQIPIFFGVYRAIANLSAGNGPADASDWWAGGFMWLDSLADPDPYKILPILAGVFQFIQTKMMRPANQGPIDDPQQRMMNQMMNFMPLMVIIFGWNFDSGPVIYWVTQSVYSVVQQWFITGWGSLNNWIPGLPELPEHRRLGYRPPRSLDDVVVVTGEDGQPVVQHGRVMGWFQKRMEEAQRQAEARRATTAATTGKAGTTASADDTAAPEEPRVKRDRSTSYQARVDAAAKRPASGGRAGRDSEVKPKSERAAGRRGGGNGQTQPPANGARPTVVPRKPRPNRKPNDG